MKKINYLFFGLLFFGFFLASLAEAQVCPVCVVAIGAGLGFSRWLKIDDIVSSIWVGAFLVSVTLGTLILMKKKGWSFPDDGVVITLAYLLLTFIPLYYSGIVGQPLNQIWGLDKIIFGSTVGTIVFFLAHWLNLYLRKKNNGKVYFYYQKVIIPFAALLLTSLIFYALLAYKII